MHEARIEETEETQSYLEAMAAVTGGRPLLPLAEEEEGRRKRRCWRSQKSRLIAPARCEKTEPQGDASLRLFS